MTDIERKILTWMAGPNTGLSSEAMAYCALQIDRRDGWAGNDHPYDPGDLNRCFLLIEQVPEVREHFSEIALMSPQWAVLISAWDELEVMFIEEVGWNWSKGDSAPKTYEKMQELLSM